MKWGTAKQFISGPKYAAETKFPRADIWVNQLWYKKVRTDIEVTIARRCIELGVPVEDKSEPIGRELLLMLNRIMLQRGTVEDIEFRAAINMTFCAVGRGGECGLSSYKLANYNTVYEAFFLEWQEKKTSAQKPMNFFCDAEHFEIDFYHSMACYWLVGAGAAHLNSTTTDFERIFPFLGLGASTKITNYLRKLVPDTNMLIPDDVTATALRVGGVQEIVNRTADIVAGTIRGGWGDFLQVWRQSWSTTNRLIKFCRKAEGHWPDGPIRTSTSTPLAVNLFGETFRIPATASLWTIS